MRGGVDWRATSLKASFTDNATYAANRDALARLTKIESAASRRVHRLDRICGNKPAKLLDFESLTLKLGSSRFWPVYLIFTTTAVHLQREPRECYGQNLDWR